jgi:hypothetical protein
MQFNGNNPYEVGKNPGPTEAMKKKAALDAEWASIATETSDEQAAADEAALQERIRRDWSK